MNILPPVYCGWFVPIRPQIRCADGFAFSVQASAGHYCSPRVSGLQEYKTVEVGFPSAHEPLLDDYDTGYDVYPHVPAGTVQAILRKHGGAVALIYTDECKEVPCGADLQPISRSE